MTSLVERFNRWRFRQVVQGIVRTPALRAGTRGFAMLSMVHHRDVQPYLLAAKTFLHFAQPSRIVLVADPSLDAQDRAVLRQHLPDIEFLEAARFHRPALPVGGTWERLAAIAALNRETSVVQVDADTVTMAPPTEVVEAAERGRSFVIRSEAGVEIVPLDAAQRRGQQLLAASRHIQAVAESRMTDLPDWQRWRYVRGCSGFTGFGKGCISPEMLDQVSEQMRNIHGSRWAEWGTEQVTSNLLAASAEGAFLLPHPRYCNADSKDDSTVVAHYIGYARHVNRDYERMARRSLSLLAA